MRVPVRIAAKLAIALEYGEGSLVFCSLRTFWRCPKIRQVVQNGLAAQ